MKKEDVKKELQNAVRKNFENNYYCFPLNEKREPTNMCELNLEEIATAYYEDRTVKEILRDEEFKITKENYVDWVKDEFRLFCLLNQNKNGSTSNF